MQSQCFRSFSYLSDTTKCDPKDQHEKADWDVEIFTDWEEPGGKWFPPAFVDFLLYVSFAADPEKHNAGQTCTERADVDRKDIHPVRDDTLDQQRYDHADDTNDSACRNS